MEKVPQPEGMDKDKRIRELEEKVATQQEEIDALKERIRNELGVDTLTGLPDRGRFEKAIGAYLAREDGENRSGLPPRVSVLYADIDHFKSVNDTYGHGVGDEVIRKVAQELQASVRGGDVLGRVAEEGQDIAGRLGGEEFVAALVGATEEQALMKAEMVRARIEALSFEGAPDLRVTISIGVAEADNSKPISLQKLLERVDGAMYSAKQGGRNRVVAATSLEPSA